MAFNQQIIIRVKELSAFQCCRCRATGIEVHHIIPQKENGPDTFDNAAPLCPNCHTWFGDNPLKRTEITQMRDWWYGRVKEMFGPQIVNLPILEDINSKVEALGNNQNQALLDLKETLKKVAYEAIEQMTAGTAGITAAGIANASIASPSPSPSPSSEDTEGGDGGSIFIFSKEFSGGGSILANGGDGNRAGDGGKINIQSDKNKFTGTVSASGGKSTKDSK